MNEQLHDIVKLKDRLDIHLLDLQNDYGYWEGKLSSSALSTAIAVFALWKFDAEKYREPIEKGLNWLKSNANIDGGWGDTIRSQSNLSTSLLTWACFSIADDRPEYKDCIEQTEKWLKNRLKMLDPQSISQAVLNHYQKDQTFSVPILAMCALSGRLGTEGWKLVPQLPYQLAIFPDRFFRWLNLSVVSYAIPALIAIGLVKAENSKVNPLLAILNKRIRSKVLRVLADKQPENGGFLEATPLTGFVLMSLLGAGEKDSAICRKAVAFLLHSVREDGSWPIDTHLASWVSSLTINALDDKALFAIADKEQVAAYFLNQQLKVTHAFTKARPGGWAWTHLPGGVPDADDTSGALIALHRLRAHTNIPLHAIKKGVEWLLDLQNSDGGLPTFCRGWGKLPFDCSCPDITAHAIHSFVIWRNDMDASSQKRIDKGIRKALLFLKNVQHKNGSWMPLWFGNEDDMKHENPVYGTSIVLHHLNALQDDLYGDLSEMKEKARLFLVECQNTDGGWGGNRNLISSIEESSLAVRALVIGGEADSINRAISYLKNNLPENLAETKATPIGLYFASLWYFEELYPIVFASSALKEVANTHRIQVLSYSEQPNPL